MKPWDAISYMLAPLLESGLLTAHDLHQYLMGFYAVVYRGHHSLEECDVVMSHIISSSLFKSRFNPIQTLVEFHEQFLTPAFINSDSYKRFVESYKDFLISRWGVRRPSLHNDADSTTRP